LLAVRGVCRLLQGDIEGATEDIAPLRSNPRVAPAGSLVYTGLLALKTGRTEEGIHDLETFIRYDPSARAELIVAEAYGVAGHLDRAAAHIKRAIALDPSCATFVASSRTFQTIRAEKTIESLLAGTDVR
jgi:tetratricopeptide (TPR) repeat protein